MRTKQLLHIATGGTIGSGITSSGVREVDVQAQSQTLQLLSKIPFTQYHSVQVQMRGDSSAHPRAHLLDLGRTALQYAGESDGIVIEHGTDTMNLSAATLALMGNEVWKTPVGFLGSIKGPEKKESDAPQNTLAMGFFAAFGDASGVFAVRPNGVIITSRHDTPGGSIDWHGRGIPQAKQAYFARVKLESLVNENYDVIFDLTKRKHRSLGRELEELIEYQRFFEDGTLDTPDEVPVGGRGRTPNVRFLGLGKTKLMEFKSRPIDDSADRVRRDILYIIEDRKSQGKAVGQVIPHLALVEHVRRHRDKRRPHDDSHLLQDKWEAVMKAFVVHGFGGNYYVAEQITKFWKEYSNLPNGAMDFTDIATCKVSTDPHWLDRAFQATPPKGVILQATGASGLRLCDDFAESYRPVLTYCRQAGIPVVLTSSSRGEVTSFEYGPGREAMKEDLTFFAGTLDADLVEPRMALLNAAQNRQFLEALVGKLDLNDSQKAVVTRNIYRTLLSGSHYRVAGEGEVSDRSLIEKRYGIETRVDLLSGMHVKKAILASYLHEVHHRNLPLPSSVVDVLK